MIAAEGELRVMAAGAGTDPLSDAGAGAGNGGRANGVVQENGL